MTKQAGLKRRVRDRMAKTGESHSAARSRLLAGAPATTTADRMAVALHVSNGDATDLPGTGLAPRVCAGGARDADLYRLARRHRPVRRPR
jgi:hypothetical protein